MKQSNQKVRLFINGHQVMPFNEEPIEIRSKPVDKKEIEKLIREKKKAAEAQLEAIKAEIAELADQAGVQAYWGEYGSGETYYPVGTDIEAEYIGWQASQYADENGKLTEGVWIASSDLC